MNSIDRRLALLITHAAKADRPDSAGPSSIFVAEVLSEATAKAHAKNDRRSAWAQRAAMCFGRSSGDASNSDDALLWMRYSLASLPIGAVAMTVCWLWFGIDRPGNFADLASSFIRSPLLP